MVFADAKHVEPDAVGGFNALEQVAQRINGRLVLPGGKTIDSEFHQTANETTS